MRRREFIAFFVGTAAMCPLSVAAQAPSGKRALIGILALNGSETDPGYVKASIEALSKLGYIDGKTATIIVRYAAGEQKVLPQLADELARLKPDVILADTPSAIKVAAKAAPTVPVVGAIMGYPVQQGLIASFAHPGGNITGFSYFDASIGSKWLSLLKELVPDLVRVVCLFNPDTAASANFFLKTLTAAGTAVGVTIEGGPVHNDADIMRVVADAAGRNDRTGLIELPDGFFDTYGNTLIAETLRLRVPTFFFLPSQISQGGLIAYAGDQLEQVMGAALYVDRILKGEKPGDLPVQGMTKFQLAINLKSAKALGISVPQSLLVRADQVIE